MRECRRAGELLAGLVGPGLQGASAETGGETIPPRAKHHSGAPAGLG